MLNCKEVQNRHSTRFFDKNNEVSNQIIRNILLAGTLAPSGKNVQPWRFFVVKENHIIYELAKILANNSWVQTSSRAILVYMNEKESYNEIKDCMAIGACVENMLLEAEASGISSCWIGDFFDKEEQIKNIIHTNEESLKLMAIVAFGYEKRCLSRPPKKDIEELVLNYNDIKD